MKQNQITIISRTIASRIEAMSFKALPKVEPIDENQALTEALVNGQPVKLRSFSAIKKTVLGKISQGGYSSSRTLNFADIYETGPAAAKQAQLAAEVDRKREKLVTKLVEIQARIIADCKLGKYEIENTAALDEFEERAAALLEKFAA